MDKNKRQKLEAAGWKIGSVAEFLELSPEEAALIEIKLSLSQSLKQLRQKQELSQSKLADRINSSQSRIAKRSAADPSVSIDLLIKGLLAVGATREDIANAIARDFPLGTLPDR